MCQARDPLDRCCGARTHRDSIADLAPVATAASSWVVVDVGMDDPFVPVHPPWTDRTGTRRPHRPFIEIRSRSQSSVCLSGQAWMGSAVVLPARRGADDDDATEEPDVEPSGRRGAPSAGVHVP